jgi:excisionase family DNA binding protein
MTKKCLSIVEAATYLNLSVHTLRKWVSYRKITFIKLGDRILFRVSDLEKLLEQNLIQPRRKAGC